MARPLKKHLVLAQLLLQGQLFAVALLIARLAFYVRSRSVLPSQRLA